MPENAIFLETGERVSPATISEEMRVEQGLSHEHMWARGFKWSISREAWVRDKFTPKPGVWK